MREQIEWCFQSELGPGAIPEVASQPLRGPVGLVSPHAGYPYSGPVAAHGFSWLARQGWPEAVVIIGTNHTGLGGPISIATTGAWETPLGTLEIDSTLAELIIERCPPVEPREEAFAEEHSVEVQLPFLQYLFGEVRFIPLVILNQQMEIAQELGRTLAELIKDKPIALIASSDFTHYEPQAMAERKDRTAIERILKLDLVGFYEVIRRDRISICGYGAIAALLEAARILELGDGQLLQYATSGDSTGERGAVVGYASIAWGREG